MGSDSNTWWKASGNELGILANGIDIEFIRKGEVLRGRKVKYEIFI